MNNKQQLRCTDILFNRNLPRPALVPDVVLVFPTSKMSKLGIDNTNVTKHYLFSYRNYYHDLVDIIVTEVKPGSFQH